MDDPSFYGFPCYGEPTVKAAQDCGGPAVDPDARGCETDAAMLGPAVRARGADRCRAPARRCARSAASTR